MVQIIKNHKHLQKLLKENLIWKNLFDESCVVGKRLSEIEKTLDEYYGEDRDIEADLGGFTIILHGTQKEILKDYESLMDKYHLYADEYEYEEIYQVPEYAVKVIFRLYICSSDYNIQMVEIVRK